MDESNERGGDGNRNDNRSYNNNNNRNRNSGNRRPKSSKEWKLIDKLLNKPYEEQAKARKWGIFFKLLTFGYLFFVLIMLLNPGMMGGKSSPGKGEEHTAMVEVNGMIMDGTEASADRIVTGLREAFEEPKAMAVLLRINSPGGSPVQSGFVYDEIMRLKGEYPEKKVFAAITDLGASGAYYIAAAADEIYADKASLIGSIGVISSGFGFSNIMEKIGVERRVITAGTNKAMMDPFSPRDPEHEKFFSTVIGTVHQQFIDSVKNGRGDRIKDDETLFSGLIWTGEQAIEMGLIDGLGSPGYVAREVVGYEEIVNYSVTPNAIESLVNKLGVSIGTTLAQHLGMQLTLR